METMPLRRLADERGEVMVELPHLKNGFMTVKKPGWLDDFRTFVMRGNVVDLAVGVVIGAAFTGIVGSLVKDIITPVIGLLTGGVDFSNHFLTLKGPAQPTLADAVKAGAVTLNYGVFLNAVINFIIVAFAIFWLVRMISKLHKAPAAVVAPTVTEATLVEIRDLLKSQGQTQPNSPAG